MKEKRAVANIVSLGIRCFVVQMGNAVMMPSVSQSEHQVFAC